MPSFYFPEVENGKSEFIVSGEEFHHIIQVLRKREGDNVLITSGMGTIAEAIITGVTRRELTISITSRTSFNRTKPHIALGFALLKNKHDHLVIEKCTELGCRTFYPIMTERTIRKGNENLANKFMKVAKAAIKQCDNAWLPEIENCNELSETIAQMRNDGYLPVAAMESDASKHLINLLNENPKQAIGIIIGPEGGFSDAECKLFENEQVPMITLGNHVLRAETAAISAISIIAGINCNRDSSYY